MASYLTSMSGTSLISSPNKTELHRRKKTRFLWTLFEGIFYNRNRGVSYKIDIFHDTREAEYIRKTMKEEIKWRFDVFF